MVTIDGRVDAALPAEVVEGVIHLLLAHLAIQLLCNLKHIRIRMAFWFNFVSISYKRTSSRWRPSSRVLRRRIWKTISTLKNVFSINETIISSKKILVNLQMFLA